MGLAVCWPTREGYQYEHGTMRTAGNNVSATSRPGPYVWRHPINLLPAHSSCSPVSVPMPEIPRIPFPKQAHSDLSRSIP